MAAMARQSAAEAVEGMLSNVQNRNILTNGARMKTVSTLSANQPLVINSSVKFDVVKTAYWANFDRLEGQVNIMRGQRNFTPVHTMIDYDLHLLIAARLSVGQTKKRCQMD